MKRTSRFDNRRRCLIVHGSLVILILFSLFIINSAGRLHAQSEPADAKNNSELQRGLQRIAPLRKPLVIARNVNESGAVNTVLELPAIADSYIASERPNQNFGADSLYLGYNIFGDNFGAQRLVVRFDVAGNIPAGAQINSARLRLRLAFSSPSDDGSMQTVLRRLASDWQEYGVTWNSEPTWTAIDDRTSVGSALDWYEWDIGAEVQAWVNGTPNDGVEIIGDEHIQERERAFYSRETNTNNFPRLVIDYTIQTDQTSPAVSVNPLPAFVGRNFGVSWGGTDSGGSGLAYYDVQYRINGGAWVDWLNQVNFTSEEYVDGKNGQHVEFRARGVDNAGNQQAYGDPQTGTTVDTQPPLTQVNPLPSLIKEDRFTLSWAGNDGGGSGIRYYDVRFRVNGGVWQLWQQQTTATSALFVTPDDGLYEFEVRAVDNLGRVEDFRGEPEAHTIVDSRPPFVTTQLWFPFMVYQP